MILLVNFFKSFYPSVFTKKKKKTFSGCLILVFNKYIGDMYTFIQCSYNIHIGLFIGVKQKVSKIYFVWIIDLI